VTPGLGNRCSIRLSYGDVLVYQVVSGALRLGISEWLRNGYGGSSLSVRALIITQAE
jgi:hypothetical protein